MSLVDQITTEVPGYRDGKKKFQAISKPGYKSILYPNVGVEFEYLVIRLFQLSGLSVCYPLSQKDEQIDGVIYLNHLPLLVESKFYKKEKVDIEPIAKLMARMQARPSFTMGLIVSRSGVTSAALEYMKFLQPKNILIFQGDEIETAIKNATNKNKLFKGLLEKKLGALVEKAKFDYHVKAFLEDIK